MSACFDSSVTYSSPLLIDSSENSDTTYALVFTLIADSDEFHNMTRTRKDLLKDDLTADLVEVGLTLRGENDVIQ